MDELTPKTKGSLATQPKSPIATKRKRSRVQLDAVSTAQTIQPETVTASPGSAQNVALSAVDAFKSATANAYTEAMSEAVPELFDFMNQVNQEVGNFMVNKINQAYGIDAQPESGADEVA